MSLQAFGRKEPGFMKKCVWNGALKHRTQQRKQIFHACFCNITHAPSYKLRDNKHILIKSILHNSALFYAQKFVQVKSADVNEPMEMWNTELESENR